MIFKQDNAASNVSKYSNGWLDTKGCKDDQKPEVYSQEK